MSKYIVAISENFVESFTVEADSQKEANEEALNLSSFQDPDVLDSNEVYSE